MRALLLLVVVLLAGVVFAACGIGDDDGDNGDPAPIGLPDGDGDANAPDDGDDAPDGDDGFLLPNSGLAAPLVSTYDTSGADVIEADLPVAPGTVIARWLQSDGMYVVHYDGLDLSVAGPLCLGNSIETASGFEFISNAPSGTGACSTATTLVAPPTGVRLCGDQVLYVTAIPVETEGMLFGSLERFRDDTTIIGLTSKVAADAAAAPDVDVSSCDTP